jgi:hypothetical protein
MIKFEPLTETDLQEIREGWIADGQKGFLFVCFK